MSNPFLKEPSAGNSNPFKVSSRQPEAPTNPFEKPKGRRPTKESMGNGSSWVDDFLFTGRLGISDTYRGVSQIAEGKGFDVPGAADADRMREDEERLNQILQDNPMAGWAGYLGGLVMDPVGWIPFAGWAKKAAQINAVRKLYDKSSKARLATDAAVMGAGGAAVGSLGYLDENAVNPLTGEKLTRGDMATMGGVGSAVLGPALQAAGKKWGKAPVYKSEMKFNPERKTGGVYLEDKLVEPGGRGHKLWDYASRPGNTGAAYGGALGWVRRMELN